MSQIISPSEFQFPVAELRAASRLPAAVRMQRRVRLTALAGGALVLSVLALATLIPLRGAVVASGQVDVASRIKRISHPGGGVVSAILVHDGQHVSKDQIIARLDDTVPGAASSLTGLTIDQLVAQRARLQAEEQGLSAITWPSELSVANPAQRDAMNAEQSLFDTRRAEAANIRAGLLARISQYQAQISSSTAQLTSARRQAALIQPEREGIGSLYARGLVPLSRRNQIERSAMELDGNMGALTGSMAETRARIAETRAQITQQAETRRADAGSQLATVNATINQERIAVANATDTRDRLVIRAPYPGIVSHLQITGVGDVVQPNEVLAEIVPDRDQLIVEATIDPSDIDQVRTGQSAHLRFSAFNRAITPEIAGKILFVGPNRTSSPDGKTSFYIARVSIDRAALDAEPDIRLRPGMPAEVYVDTGSRSMLSYILKPLSDQFARVMRD